MSLCGVVSCCKILTLVRELPGCGSSMTEISALAPLEKAELEGNICEVSGDSTLPKSLPQRSAIAR